MSTPSGTEVAPQSSGPNVVVVKQKRGWAGAFLVIIGLLGLLCAGYVGLSVINLVPDIKNPFQTEVEDRSGPVLLQSMEDLSLFVAARGNFQVVVDYKEDRAYVPEFISSYHVLFVGYGSVEAYVDFAALDEDAIQVSPDQTEVTITLPEPQLSEVRLDVNQSQIYSLDEGIFETVRNLVTEDVNRQGQLYQLAVEKIETAAQQSELLERAKDNTRIKLEGMMRSLGFERVTINFATNPA
jgi:Protein of unknown function (DUF4230)